MIEFGAAADFAEQLAGGFLDAARQAGAHRAQFGEQRIGGLVDAGDELRAGRIEAAGDVVGGLVDGRRDAEGRTVEIGDKFGARLGDAVEIIRWRPSAALG